MNVAAIAVRNFRLTIVVFALLIALGANSWLTIPRGEDPVLNIPGFSVVAVLPGASPEDLERLVARRIEERLDQLEDIDRLQSTIVDGVVTTSIEFEADKDPDRKYEEVVREINALRADLPAELERLDVYKFTTLDVSIAQFALVSETTPYHELDRIAESLTDRLGTLPGVRTAERWGVPERQVNVDLDLGRLSRLNLPAGLVLQTIAGESGDLPAGSVENGTRRFNVRASGGYETLDEIRSTVLRTSNGHIVRVADVADVAWGYADTTYLARHNGKRAAFVTVTMQEGENIGRVRDRVWRVLDDFETFLPATVRLERGFDQAEIVSHRLNRLGEDFAIAILLVLVTLLPLGTRASAIVMVSIPLSLAIGVTILKFTGFTINQLSIVGSVIALGLIVDDSIVVVENIARFMREGHSRRQAAMLATRQISLAVLGATATLVFAFVPLVFLPGAPGQYIRSLPVAVIYTVVASLFVSLTIIPWLASMILREKEPEGGNRFLRLFERVAHRTYTPLLDKALRYPQRTLLLSAVFVAASLALVPVVGFSLFPKAETPRFYVDITAPEGASLSATDAAARFAESVISRRPEVRTIFTSVGHDNPQIYYNVIPRRDDPRVGQLYVLLHEYDPQKTPALLDSLRAELGEYAGARIEVLEFENGPPIDAPIALRIMGAELDTLGTLAGRVEEILESTAGTQYVENPVRLKRTDLRVRIDRGRAGLLAVPLDEIDRTVRLSLAGIDAGVVREPDGEERDIVVKLAGAGHPSAATLDRVYVASQTGVLTPLRQVADVGFESGVARIDREDRERSVTVTSFVRTGYNTDRVTREVLERVASLRLPPGYRIVAAGEIESRQESFGGIGSAVLVAMFAVLAILVLEFKTFRSTLIVASVIPFGIMGGILALFFTGWTLSFAATIGFVALIGIEIKASILLVDFANQLRAEGMSLEDAVRRAGEVRFLPIVLTSMTAIGGLLPLALQGQALYAPLAWVIIGGLLASTALARIVTPVMYKLLPPSLQNADER